MDEMKYSREVEDILTKKPSVIVRTGIPLIGLIFIILLITAYFIPYPEGVDCIAFFGDTEKPELSVTGQHADARIYLPDKEITRLKPGQQIRLTLKDCAGMRLTTKGTILSIDEREKFLFIRFEQPASELISRKAGSSAAFPPQGCESVIITGKSNMLYQIFIPVISVFRNASANKPE